MRADDDLRARALLDKVNVAAVRSDELAAQVKRQLKLVAHNGRRVFGGSCGGGGAAVVAAVDYVICTGRGGLLRVVSAVGDSGIGVQKLTAAGAAVIGALWGGGGNGKVLVSVSKRRENEMKSYQTAYITGELITQVTVG